MGTLLHCSRCVIRLALTLGRNLGPSQKLHVAKGFVLPAPFCLEEGSLAKTFQSLEALVAALGGRKGAAELAYIYSVGASAPCSISIGVPDIPPSCTLAGLV